MWAEAFLGLDFLFTFSSMEKVKAQRLERNRIISWTANSLGSEHLSNRDHRAMDQACVMLALVCV